MNDNMNSSQPSEVPAVAKDIILILLEASSYGRTTGGLTEPRIEKLLNNTMNVFSQERSRLLQQVREMIDQTQKMPNLYGKKGLWISESELSKKLDALEKGEGV